MKWNHNDAVLHLLPLQGAQLLTAAKGLSNLKVNLTHLQSCHF